MSIDWLANLDEWQSHESAPRDGTPIYVSIEGGAAGVFYWEERSSFLGKSRAGKAMPPTWIGFFIVSELYPAVTGDGHGNEVPLGDRLLGSQGLEEPFLWKPLPARPASHEPTGTDRGTD